MVILYPSNIFDAWGINEDANLFNLLLINPNEIILEEGVDINDSIAKKQY